MNTSGYHRKRNTLYHILMFLFFSVAILAGGCTRILNSYFADTVSPPEGEIKIAGLKNHVTIRRDDLGIPFVEAETLEDLVFAVGYTNASDRLDQMIGLKLLSQGRLAEMAGPAFTEIDIYIRTLNLIKAARMLYNEISDERQALIRRYCDGVNAYLDLHRENLHPALELSGYTPEQWEPMDCFSIFVLVNLALSFNMYEEINTLNIVQAVGPEKAAWLVPIYPDEAVPLEEAKKLTGIDLTYTSQSIDSTLQAQTSLQTLGLMSIAASNNWVISKDLTKGNASIFANDTHLMLSLPSLWNLMHVRCKDYDVAGVGIAGVPSLVAGYNGHIAWGMTMVMADNQDIFLEQLKEIGGKLHYLHQGEWKQAVKREETIAIRGEEPLHITVYETIHGPLFNDALKKNPKSFLQPPATRLPLGIALSWAAFEPGDQTMEAFYGITRSRSVSEAMEHAKQIRAIALNIVMADHDNIAWQVTGRYPLRKKGRGVMPSPGWTGKYDWDGFLDSDKHPFSLNPSGGFFGTANDRTVPADFPHILSSTWYWPERGERIKEMIASTKKHTLQTSMDMQLDIFTLFTDKLKKSLLEGDLHFAIIDEIDSWKDAKRKQKAHEAMEMLRRFDGFLKVDSRQAPIIGALFYTATHNTFSDELGPEESNTWASFIANINIGYCAASDHLAVRGDESPFWDDVTTPEKETKAQIMARSFADSIDLLEKHMGKDRLKWSWGRLHTYYWKTEASKMSQHMGRIERFGMKLLSSYFNRGPFPAPGDHTTLNVSGYDIARNFDTWLIPAVRMIVDFSLEEPFYSMNSSGQSDNPASQHYDDGIYEWLRGNYRPMPFKQENIKKHYTRVLVLKPLE